MFENRAVMVISTCANMRHREWNLKAKKKKIFFHFLSLRLWRMFAPVDISVSYHHWCLRLYFQSFSNIQPEISSQNKWLSSFKKIKNKKKIPDLPTLISFYVTPIKPIFLGLSYRSGNLNPKPTHLSTQTQDHYGILVDSPTLSLFTKQINTLT